MRGSQGSAVQERGEEVGGEFDEGAVAEVGFGEGADAEAAEAEDAEAQGGHQAADVAVAAASILARAEFVQRMKALGEEAGMPLPKGASAEVLKTAKLLVQQLGAEGLSKFAKMHFKTANEALGITEETDHAPA